VFDYFSSYNLFENNLFKWQKLSALPRIACADCQCVEPNHGLLRSRLGPSATPDANLGPNPEKKNEKKSLRLNPTGRGRGFPRYERRRRRLGSARCALARRARRDLAAQEAVSPGAHSGRYGDPPRHLCGLAAGPLRDCLCRARGYVCALLRRLSRTGACSS